MMEKDSWKSSLFLYGLMILAMVLIVYCKKNYDVDELLSFTLSNNDTGWMHFEDGRKYNSEDLFESQFAAQTNRLFDYTTVWNNQAGDVHPPLYYAILHTICSLTPQRISKWQPAIINFIFALLTLYIQRRIWALFLPKVQTEKRSKLIQNIVFGVWVLLPGVLNAIAFFRMYIMAMFMVTWVSYLCLKIFWINVSGGKSWKQWMFLFGASICSALTHYYCVMFLVLIEIVLMSFLFIYKKWKEIGIQILVAALSAVSAISVFPEMLTHVFEGYRGNETMENFRGLSLENYLKQLKIFYEFVNNSIAGGLLGFFLVLLVMLYLLKKTDEEDIQGKMKINMLVLLIFPCVGYYLLLGRITVMNSERYIVPLYAIMFICLISLIEMILKWSKLLPWEIGMLMVLALILTRAYQVAEWGNLYRDDDLQEIMTEYVDLDALVVYDAAWECVTLYKELKTNSVTLINNEGYELLNKTDIINDSEFVAFVTETSQVEQLVEKMGGKMQYEELGSFSYFTAYYMYCG